jgi:hypothetical protein
MRKLLLAVCLTLALPVLFSGRQRIVNPISVTAVACDLATQATLATQSAIQNTQSGLAPAAILVNSVLAACQPDPASAPSP